jgi:hypothetical protein
MYNDLFETLIEQWIIVQLFKKNLPFDYPVW